VSSSPRLYRYGIEAKSAHKDKSAGTPARVGPPLVVRTIEVHGGDAQGAVPNSQPTGRRRSCGGRDRRPAGPDPAGPATSTDRRSRGCPVAVSIGLSSYRPTSTDRCSPKRTSSRRRADNAVDLVVAVSIRCHRFPHQRRRRA
jgi:hypothetical protein